MNEGEEDSPHSDRDREKPAPPGHEEQVNEENVDSPHSDRDREKPHGYEEGEEDHGHDADHESHDDNELQSTE